MLILGHFWKGISFAREASEKDQTLIYRRTTNIIFCKRVEIFKSFMSLISSPPANLLKKYTFTCWLLVCILSRWIISSRDFPMLKSCWVHSKNNNLLFSCFSWWNELWSKTYKLDQNPEPATCRCSARQFFWECH